MIYLFVQSEYIYFLKEVYHGKIKNILLGIFCNKCFQLNTKRICMFLDILYFQLRMCMCNSRPLYYVLIV